MNARFSFAAVLALLGFAAAPAAAQRGRFELVPQVGYTFGGGFDVDPQVINGQAYPAGKLKLDESISYGATLGFEGARGTYFTVSYQLQPTQIGIEFKGTPPSGVFDFSKKGDITIHQVLFGGRWEYLKSSEQKARPYLGAGLGFVIVDPNFELQNGASPDSETRFLLSLNGGVRYMMGEEKRFGLQADIKGTWFWVPSGDYYTWCDYWYGCSVYEGSATIAQGTASAGVIIKF